MIAHEVNAVSTLSRRHWQCNVRTPCWMEISVLQLQKLQAAGIACSYVHLTALSFVVRDVTKVS